MSVPEVSSGLRGLRGPHLPVGAVWSSHPYYVGNSVLLLFIPIIQQMFEPLLCSGSIEGKDGPLIVWWRWALMKSLSYHT